jgi:tripartite ATP-independent transporter DctM subunit
MLIVVGFRGAAPIGMPVAFAIGIAGALFFVQHPELPPTIPIQLTISQTQNFALLAVPLFILAGNVMNHSGSTRELLNLAAVHTGRLKGGLAQVSIALATLMGGVSGSCIADAAMQTRMLGAEMLKRGFSRGYAAGVLSFGSLMTLIIRRHRLHPAMARSGQVSIGRLFAAGFIRLPAWAASRSRFHPAQRGYQPERTARAPCARGGCVARHLGAPVPGVPACRLRFGVFTPRRSAPSRWSTPAVGLFRYRQPRARAFERRWKAA